MAEPLEPHALDPYRPPLLDVDDDLHLPRIVAFANGTYPCAGDASTVVSPGPVPALDTFLVALEHDGVKQGPFCPRPRPQFHGNVRCVERWLTAYPFTPPAQVEPKARQLVGRQTGAQCALVECFYAPHFDGADTCFARGNATGAANRGRKHEQCESAVTHPIGSARAGVRSRPRWMTHRSGAPWWWKRWLRPTWPLRISRKNDHVCGRKPLAVLGQRAQGRARRAARREVAIWV